MAKARRFADIRRALVRRLDNQPDVVLRELRDELWERLIARQFFRGRSIATIASDQPNWASTATVEDCIRRQARKRAPKWMR